MKNPSVKDVNLINDQTITNSWQRTKQKARNHAWVVPGQSRESRTVSRADDPHSVGKLEVIIFELVSLKKRELISDSRFITLFSSLIERLNDYYYHLVTSSLRVSM